MLLPLGMQFLRIGEEHEIGYREDVGRGEMRRCMVRDLEHVLEEKEERVAWKYAEGSADVVVREMYRFRVEA